MDLLSKDFLQFIDETIYPKPKSLSNGQVWYDTLSGSHGVVVANTLYFFAGWFTTICDKDLSTGQYLYQPTVQDFMWFTPGAKIEVYGGQFSVTTGNGDTKKLFLSANPLEACARAYLSFFIVKPDTVFE